MAGVPLDGPDFEDDLDFQEEFEEIFGVSSSDDSDAGYSGLDSTISTVSSLGSLSTDPNDSGRGVFFDSSEEDIHHPFPDSEESDEEEDSSNDESNDDDDVPLDVLLQRLPNLNRRADRVRFWRGRGVFDRIDPGIGEVLEQGLLDHDPIAEAFAANQDGYDADVEDFDHEWHI